MVVFREHDFQFLKSSIKNRTVNPTMEQFTVTHIRTLQVKQELYRF